MPLTPEQLAREAIDANLAAAGWCVQNRGEQDLAAGRGIAVREFPMRHGYGFADYLLYVDRKAVGAIEAKAEGTLTGVEAQSAKYAADLPDLRVGVHATVVGISLLTCDAARYRTCFPKLALTCTYGDAGPSA